MPTYNNLGSTRSHVTRGLFAIHFVLLLVIAGLLGGYFTLNAATSNRNKPLVFQGRITNASYVPLSDGTSVYLKYAVYDAATAGNCLWGTGIDSSGANNCPIASASSTALLTTVTRGVFTAALGDTTVSNMPALPLDFNAGSYYVGVSACTAATSGCDAEMTPRVRIGGAAYAYNADELDGINSTSFLRFHNTATGDTVTSGTATSTIWRAGAYSAQSAVSELIDFDLDFATNGLQYTTGASLATQRTMLIRSRTYSATAATQVISHASTFDILGSPTVGSNAAITNSSALRVQTANVGASTNSYALYVDAMSGATNNYAAAFASGNVGIGDATPDYVLELNRSTGIANAFSMSADDVAHGLTALHNGTFQQQLETGTFFQVGVLNGGGAGTGGALLTGASDDGDTPGMRIISVTGNNNPTDESPALYFTGAKKDGAGTGRTALGNSETVLWISNNDNTTGRVVVNGSGDLGLGDISPNGTLDLLSSSTASSTSIIITNTGGTTDPVINFEVTEGTGAFSVGVDNDDSDRFKISTTALGTNDMLRLDSRLTTSAITAHDIRGLGATLASSAGVEYTTLTVTPPTITLTLGTQVTSQMDSILFSSPLITDTTAITVDDAALLTISGGPAAGGSVTITDSYGLKINSVTVNGGGTVTRSTALYVDALSGAASNYAAVFATGNVGIGTTTPATTLGVSGTVSYTPSTTQSITANTDAILANAGVVVINNTTGFGINLNTGGAATIANGATGQILYIIGASGMASVTLNDQDSQGASNLQLGAASRAITASDVLQLIYDSTTGDWLEVSFATN